MKFDHQRAYKDWYDHDMFPSRSYDGASDCLRWLAEEIDISDTFPCDQKKPCKNHQFQRINLYLSSE